MSEEPGYSDPLFVLLGALGSAFAGAMVWICKNKCRNQQCDCDSGCCRFHSDSRLRETIRQEIQEEKKRSESGDLEGFMETSEEIELTLPKEGLP
jgi:hypothetical protein